MRAIESERRDALFHDVLARKLTGDKGKELLACLQMTDEFNFEMVMRTKVIDDLIYQIVRSHSDVVLNLAAGLDTRPYRLDLPSQLRWIEADYPGVVQYKNKTLADDKPMCQLERRPVDLSDDKARRDLLRQVNGETRQGTVITEGILGYLTEENVEALARDLHAQESIKWWITGVTSREFASWMHERIWSSMNPTLAPWIQEVIRDVMTPMLASSIQSRLAQQGTEFFRAFGWETAAFHSFISEGQRLGRMPPLTWPSKATSGLEQSGIAILRRLDS